MRLKFTPAVDSLFLQLECRQYQDVWQKHGRDIMRGFTDVTGLQLQQRYITARIIAGNVSNAGRSGIAMQLAGDYRSEQFKLMTIEADNLDSKSGPIP